MVCASQSFRQNGRLITLLEILQVYASKFADIVSHMQSAVNHIGSEPKFLEDPLFCSSVMMDLEQLEEICNAGELPVTNVLVRHLVGMFRLIYDPDEGMAALAAMVSKAPAIGGDLERMRLTFIDELSTKLFFQLRNEKKEWFEIPRKGWEKITERFPDTVTDIEEMSKCLALSRYAASVFHSLLIVERGLIELGRAIGVTDPKPGWDATCNKMKILLDGGHKSYPPSLTIGFSALEQINQAPQSMKMAWRNKVNHAAGCLTVMSSDFVPDVAEEIVLGTRGFMRRLATDLP